jgi:hypothetical protein
MAVMNASLAVEFFEHWRDGTGLFRDRLEGKGDAVGRSCSRWIKCERAWRHGLHGCDHQWARRVAGEKDDLSGGQSAENLPGCPIPFISGRSTSIIPKSGANSPARFKASAPVGASPIVVRWNCCARTPRNPRRNMA